MKTKLKTEPEDCKRLLYISQQIDGFCDEDIHEWASYFADQRSVEEPEDEDYLKAIRRVVDLAMDDEGWE